MFSVAWDSYVEEHDVTFKATQMSLAEEMKDILADEAAAAADCAADQCHLHDDDELNFRYSSDEGDEVVDDVEEDGCLDPVSPSSTVDVFTIPDVSTATSSPAPATRSPVGVGLTDEDMGDVILDDVVVGGCLGSDSPSSSVIVTLVSDCSTASSSSVCTAPAFPVVKVSHTCAFCLSGGGSIDKVSVFKCGACKVTYYCSRDHQRAHWSVHKKVCIPMDSPTPASTLPSLPLSSTPKSDLASWVGSRKGWVDVAASGWWSDDDLSDDPSVGKDVFKVPAPVLTPNLPWEL